MLFIPLLCVLVALSLGKPENYRLPKWTSLLYIPTALLLLLVLTNDLHQLVFVFPADAAVWLDTDHGYGAGYFLVMGWIALGMVTAIVTMLLKCRIPHTKITLGLPFVPVALAALYSVLYISRIAWIELLAGDMTVVQCLLLAAGIESCIRCGLIQSNTGYRALFEASGIRAEITDRDGQRYTEVIAADVSELMAVCAHSWTQKTRGWTRRTRRFGSWARKWRTLSARKKF